METICPSVDEWIKKLWNIYTVEHYLALKRKNIGICTICNLQSIILCEKVRKRHRLYDLSYTWNLKQTNK